MSDYNRLYEACLGADGTEINDIFDASEVVLSLGNKCASQAAKIKELEAVLQAKENVLIQWMKDHTRFMNVANQLVEELTKRLTEANK